MTTRTAVELVKRLLAAMKASDKPSVEATCADARALDAKVTAMRARLAALEAFAEEVRSAYAREEDGDGGHDVYAFADAVVDALAKLPVKP